MKNGNKFTFHYGQIYYYRYNDERNSKQKIYIPLWLDLLLNGSQVILKRRVHLHSTMVRFIMTYLKPSSDIKNPFTFHYGQIYYRICFKRVCFNLKIYIPLWLDLLYLFQTFITSSIKNLHSTMVRFIMAYKVAMLLCYSLFTFHYGQIYYYI